MGRVPGLLGRRARWARPTVAQYAALWTAALALVAGGVLVHRVLLGAPQPEGTLSEAYTFLGGGVSLAAAQDEAWRLSVEAGGGLAGQTDALLSPPLPPALCVPAEPGGTSVAGPPKFADVNGVIRRLDAAVRTGDRAGVEEALERAVALGGGLPSTPVPFVQLSVARGYAWAGDLGLAARVLGQAELAGVEGGDVPIVATRTAMRLFESGRVTREQAVLAFHLRYLAGLVAHRRGRPGEAIAHFRRALNGVNYVVGTGDDLGGAGHYRRTSMAPGALGCGGLRGSELTSLDAYTGLVAAYMAARDFRDPTRLAREVGRRGFEVDPDDPLTPLLVHAQDVARGERETPIPEHVFWASSNLQRVYHYNRLRPDRRLALTRAVLTLRILDDSTWTGALGIGDETCDMLAGLGQSLHQDSGAPWSPSAERGPTDSAWAAVAVHTFARLEADCPGQAPPPVDVAVRGEWLQLGGTLLHAGLVARYEALRRALERGGGAAPDRLVHDVMARVRSDRQYFSTGRIPPDLGVTLDAGMAASFVERWQRAVFREVAQALVDGVRSGGRENRIRAGDAARYLGAVNGAVHHGGLTPVDAYRPETLAVLARSGGTLGSARYQVAYHARSHPGATRLILVVGVLGAALATVMVFVSWWRYTLLTRRDFFGLESAGRGAASSTGVAEGGDPRPAESPVREVG